MWQYVDYVRIFLAHLMVSYCGGWLFFVRCRVICVVNVFIGHSRKTFVMKLLSRHF